PSDTTVRSAAATLVTTRRIAQTARKCTQRTVTYRARPPADVVDAVRVVPVPSVYTPRVDAVVRRALPSIVKNLYAGQAKPFSGGVADTDFGFNPALKPYPYDPAKAKALLAEAGYAGQELTMHAGYGTMDRSTPPNGMLLGN